MRLHSPKFLNLSGDFTVNNVIPTLDKIQYGKTVRMIKGSIIVTMQDFLKTNPSVIAIEIYGGYTSLKNERFSNTNRTYLGFNNQEKTGCIKRQPAISTYNYANPSLVVILPENNIKVLSSINHLFKFNYYAHFDNDVFSGFTFISLQ